MSNPGIALRVATLAAGLVLGLAGCGSDDAQTASGTVSPAITSSVVAGNPGASTNSTPVSTSGVATSHAPMPSAVPSGPLTTSTTPDDSAASGSASGKPVPWETGKLPSAVPAGSAASGAANLTILLDDGFGVRSTWTLLCDPLGGTHPHPDVACGVLGANGAKALAKPKADQACTMIYGGPQKAKITGTWHGAEVSAEFSREDGCQVARWDSLLGLLPQGGVATS